MFESENSPDNYKTFNMNIKPITKYPEMQL